MKLRELFETMPVAPTAPANTAGAFTKMSPNKMPAVVKKPAVTTALPAAKPAPALNNQANPEPAPFNPADYKDALVSAARKAGMQDQDLAQFLGNARKETNNWIYPAENMHYKDPKRAHNFFTSKFPKVEDAIPYMEKPVALANFVYAGKDGNGDVTSGDGWRYRGRGFMHVTCKNAYAKLGAVVHPENPNIYVNNPELLSTNPAESIKASVMFYMKKVGTGKTSKQASKAISGSNKSGQKQRDQYSQEELRKLRQTKPAKK